MSRHCRTNVSLPAFSSFPIVNAEADRLPEPPPPMSTSSGVNNPRTHARSSTSVRPPKVSRIWNETDVAIPARVNPRSQHCARDGRTPTSVRSATSCRGRASTAPLPVPTPYLASFRCQLVGPIGRHVCPACVSGCVKAPPARRPQPGRAWHGDRLASSGGAKRMGRRRLEMQQRRPASREYNR
jgi:hypothetical protein